MKKIYISLLTISCAFFASCDEDFKNDVTNIEVQSGNANFNEYIALGNSLTAGFTDGALYSSAQQNSFPAIIASSMTHAGGSEFAQPLMPDDIGGFSDLFAATGSFYGKLTLNGTTPTPSAPQFTFQQSFVQGDFDNLGVPGARSYHLLANGYGNAAGVATGQANPYFARFASSPNVSLLEEAASKNPTFYTLWIGNNDLLGYALAGGAGTNQTGNYDPSTYGSTDLSDANVVINSIDAIAQTMASVNAKGAIANLPYVTSIPALTTVPSKPLSVSNEAYASQISTLNQFYGSLNQAFLALGVPERSIYFSEEEDSGVVIKDESLQDISQQLTAVLVQVGYPAAQAGLIGQTFGQVRQTGEGDLIPLTTLSSIAQIDTDRVNLLTSLGLDQASATQLSINGLTNPFADQYVLTITEVNEVLEVTNQINNGIHEIASNYGLAHVDANNLMQELSTTGIRYNGVAYNASFIAGGAFSLDGVHLTSRGYSIIANEFLEAINYTFGSNLPLSNPNNYNGIILE